MENFNILTEIKKQKAEKEFTDKYFIADIPFKDILKEDSIDGLISFSQLPNGQVYVYTKEWIYAHCHIVFKNSKVHDCCILLTEPAYFMHEGKDTALNSRQMKCFIDWCKQRNTKFPAEIVGSDATNFKVMLFVWNINNPDNQVDPNLSMPNYTSQMRSIKS